MGCKRSIFLYPLSFLYGLITGFRNFLYNTEILKSHTFPMPVICVGNLTAGGTGKTPLTEYLVNLLREDFNVVVLSRGYKRKTRGFLFAGENSRSEDIGDEPLQIARKFPGITVAVDRKRVHGVREILEKKPDSQVIILDDAFQHRSITPGYSILLSDFDRLMIHDQMLPYGNLRESIANMKRADIIMITKSPETITPIQRRLIVKEIQKAPYQELFFTSITYKTPLPVFDDVKAEKDIFSRRRKENPPGIVLVSGIANPKPLAGYLQKLTGEIINLPFGDHHKFSNSDFEKIMDTWESLKSSRKYLITTEKDAVRIREFTNIAEAIRKVFYYIPVVIKFLKDNREEFDNLITEYVGKNKRNNRIS
jgi:tetraacyldisaccharide 4'-kinase